MKQNSKKGAKRKINERSNLKTESNKCFFFIEKQFVMFLKMLFSKVITLFSKSYNMLID